MGIFNMFGDQEHRVFNYKPIYFDPEKEELKRKFGAVDGSLEKKMQEEGYVPGSYIKDSMREGRYKSTKRTTNRAQNIIGLVGLLLFAVVLIYFAKFFTIL